jgi:glycosyltransferase involved in cell wall biosynthesis
MHLEMHLKGTDVLIEAVAPCARTGLNPTLTIVGDGRRRPEFEALARRLGVERRVEFLGAHPVRRENL